MYIYIVIIWCIDISLYMPLLRAWKCFMILIHMHIHHDVTNNAHTHMHTHIIAIASQQLYIQGSSNSCNIRKKVHAWAWLIIQSYYHVFTMKYTRGNLKIFPYDNYNEIIRKPQVARVYIRISLYRHNIGNP